MNTTETQNIRRSIDALIAEANAEIAQGTSPMKALEFATGSAEAVEVHGDGMFIIPAQEGDFPVSIENGLIVIGWI